MATATRPLQFSQEVVRWKPVRLNVTSVIVELNATHRLMVLRFLTSAELDRIVEAYVSEKDVQRREVLKSCYKEITGVDIESRVSILQD